MKSQQQADREIGWEVSYIGFTQKHSLHQACKCREFIWEETPGNAHGDIGKWDREGNVVSKRCIK